MGLGDACASFFKYSVRSDDDFAPLYLLFSITSLKFSGRIRYALVRPRENIEPLAAVCGFIGFALAPLVLVNMALFKGVFEIE